MLATTNTALPNPLNPDELEPPPSPLDPKGHSRLYTAYGAIAEWREPDDKRKVADKRTEKDLDYTLTQMLKIDVPQISSLPAPPALPPLGDPTLTHDQPPLSLVDGRFGRKSYLTRCLNTTVGRAVIFLCTMAMFNMSINGLTSFNKPENVLDGSSLTYLLLSLWLTFTMYTCPLLAERAGMTARETGWKPYLAAYRCAVLLSCPALVLMTLGKGQELWNGVSAGSPGTMLLADLKDTYWSYFELQDGFVALNLTKGITETLAAAEHGPEEHRRISRFRDTELRINTEPFSDATEPTETPGTVATYRIAPLFTNWAFCTTRYRISINCLRQNPRIGWAIARSSSFCSRFQSAACRPPRPVLQPLYQCSSDDNGGIRGDETRSPISGICGRVTKPPPDGAIDELSALLMYESWPAFALPGPSDIWIDVSADECISDPQSCKDTWNQLWTAGFILQIVVNLCIFLVCLKDCVVDHEIRAARKFMEKMETDKKRAADVSRIKAARGDV